MARSSKRQASEFPEQAASGKRHEKDTIKKYNKNRKE
jgi:hypothetical protein